MSCHPSHVTPSESAKKDVAQRFSREIDRHHRWTAGHDPNDDDAVEGSPWRYVKISGENIVEDERKANPYERKHGPSSGIVCIYCHGAEMAVIDEKPAEEIIKGVIGYDWQVMRGRRHEITAALLLICPKCEKVMQISEEVVRMKMTRRSTSGRHGEEGAE